MLDHNKSMAFWSTFPPWNKDEGEAVILQWKFLQLLLPWGNYVGMVCLCVLVGLKLNFRLDHCFSILQHRNRSSHSTFRAELAHMHWLFLWASEGLEFLLGEFQNGPQQNKNQTTAFSTRNYCKNLGCRFEKKGTELVSHESCFPIALTEIIWCLLEEEI